MPTKVCRIRLKNKFPQFNWYLFTDGDAEKGPRVSLTFSVMYSTLLVRGVVVLCRRVGFEIMSDFHPLSFPRPAGPVSGGGHLNKAPAAAGHEFAPFTGISNIQFLMFPRLLSDGRDRPAFRHQIPKEVAR